MIKKLYKIIYLRLKTDSRLSWYCDLKERHPIETGTRCKIHRYVTLDSSKGPIRLGDRVTLNRYAYLLHHVEIGHGSEINNFTRIDGWGGVFIGDDVLIGPNVQILSYQHAYRRADRTIKRQGIVKKPIHIEDDVWIGASSVILAGVRVGRGAVIGAGSVVTKDVAPYSVVVGSPARKIGQREDHA